MIIIDHYGYGVCATFPTLADAQAAIRACGPDFETATLSLHAGVVYDEHGDILGREANYYTPDDVGCYVDSARGIFAVDRIIEFVEAHDEDGFQHSKDCKYCANPHTAVAYCEFASEHEDDATDYMNDHYAVANHYWGRNENGDWGLWPVEDS